MREGPFTAFDFFFLGHADFDQMTDSRRQYVVVTLEVVFLFGKTAQCLGDVVCDRRFFSDDEALAHEYQYFSSLFANGFADPKPAKGDK